MKIIYKNPIFKKLFITLNQFVQEQLCSSATFAIEQGNKGILKVAALQLWMIFPEVSPSECFYFLVVEEEESQHLRLRRHSSPRLL